MKDSDLQFTIFTTRADTIFGVTFMVLAPESELVEQLTTAGQRAAVDEYLAYVKKRTERERISDRKVTGVFSGSSTPARSLSSTDAIGARSAPCSMRIITIS